MMAQRDLSLLLLAVASVACTIQTASSPSAPPPTATAPVTPTVDLSPTETLERLARRFRYGGGAAERQELVTEIDEVSGRLSFLAAGIAKRRLTASNRIPERVALARSADGTTLTVSLDDRTYVGPLDGSSVEVKGIDGDTLQMEYVISRGRIEQRFRGPNGGRVNTFLPHEERGMLMEVRVFSQQLPEDVRYRLTYVAERFSPIERYD